MDDFTVLEDFCVLEVFSVLDILLVSETDEDLIEKLELLDVLEILAEVELLGVLVILDELELFEVDTGRVDELEVRDDEETLELLELITSRTGCKSTEFL